MNTASHTRLIQSIQNWVLVRLRTLRASLRLADAPVQFLTNSPAPARGKIRRTGVTQGFRVIAGDHIETRQGMASYGTTIDSLNALERRLWSSSGYSPDLRGTVRARNKYNKGESLWIKNRSIWKACFLPLSSYNIPLMYSLESLHLQPCPTAQIHHRFTKNQNPSHGRIPTKQQCSSLCLCRGPAQESAEQYRLTLLVFCSLFHTLYLSSLFILSEPFSRAL